MESQSQLVVEQFRKAPCATCTEERRSELCWNSTICENYQQWAKEYRERREVKRHDR